MALQAEEATIRDRCQSALRWLEDETLYPSEPANAERVPARLSQKELKLIIERNKASRTSSDKARAFCRVFKVAEHAKRRFRLIQHPLFVNENTALPFKTSFIDYHERYQLVHRGLVVVDVDFAAWFDQFELKEEVRKYFTFLCKGEHYHMNVLPMGLKQSVAIAHSTTLQLLNFKHTSSIEAYIDNIRFIGTKEQVVADVSTFFRRVAAVGATLNEVDLRALPSDDTERERKLRDLAEGLVKSKGDWLGEHFDYINKTVEMSAKTREKITRCLELFDDDNKKPTWKNFASTIALLQYASRTLDLKLGPFFGARRALAAASAFLSEDPSAWNDEARKPELHVLQSMKKWQRAILEANPRAISRDRPPEAVLICDASGIGWAASFATEHGTIKVCRGDWTEADKKSGLHERSPHAEPEGIYRAICRFVRPSQRLRLLVITDSSTAKAALQKGHSPAFIVNAICTRCSMNYPNLEIETMHIPGPSMPMDGMSRGKIEPSVVEWARIMELTDKALAGGKHDVVNGTSVLAAT
jgi:hypothetical protein